MSGFLSQTMMKTLYLHDNLIGLPVISHHRVNTHTPLLERRDKLNETDCIQDTAYVNNGNNKVRGIMIHRLNNVPTPDYNRPRVNFYKAQYFQDPFPDPRILDPIDEVQHESIAASVKNLLATALKNKWFTIRTRKAPVRQPQSTRRNFPF